MPIQYSLVSRGKTILAEQAMVPGNFSQVVPHVLSLIADSREPRKSFTHTDFMFHSLKEDEIIYLAIADKDFDESMAFRYLSEIQTKFYSRYSAFAYVAFAYAMNMEFSKVMLAKMKRYNAAMQDQLEDIKRIMARNVEEVDNRGEQLGLLMGRTEMLSNDTRAFQRSSRAGWWEMLRKNLKWIILILLTLLLVTYIVASAACGGPAWPKCVGPKSSNHNSTGRY
ncbi:hypothetical protein HELRODRAFT_80799 [Helobdella robusta]|uniref:Vesicle-associated membrane protein 7 n=1 Tax=Helobdella robusta TaxID=6412 RepID=T1G457_HELRO|nr:hypothetical protein HELRODRAFT_80799 [Helobdella robusta]ESO03229.1 hypothetical protein HELRODRAFT_80799 [Helobdella robusta]